MQCSFVCQTCWMYWTLWHRQTLTQWRHAIVRHWPNGEQCKKDWQGRQDHGIHCLPHTYSRPQVFKLLFKHVNETYKLHLKLKHTFGHSSSSDYRTVEDWLIDWLTSVCMKEDNDRPKVITVIYCNISLGGKKDRKKHVKLHSLLKVQGLKVRPNRGRTQCV